MIKRFPTQEEYQEHAGWVMANRKSGVTEEWICLSCKRTLFEIMKWTKRDCWGSQCSRGCTLSNFQCIGKGYGHLRKGMGFYWGWRLALESHHDHGEETQRQARFPRTLICQHCNSADGIAKYQLCLPADFSFSPQEIGQFVIVRPHESHVIDYKKALDLYEQICARSFRAW